MILVLHKITLYIKLLWTHITFWSFPTLEETYYSQLGAIYFQLEKFNHAIIAFVKSEKAHDFKDKGYSKYNSYYLGYSYLNLGDFVKAADFFENYLSLNPDDNEINPILGWCYDSAYDEKNALKYYSASVMQRPNDSSSHLNCAGKLFELNRKEDALNHIDLAIQYAEGDYRSSIAEALKHEIRDELNSATQILKIALSKIKSDSQNIERGQIGNLYTTLAKYQRKTGELDGALRTLEEAYKEDKEDLWVVNELAMEYADKKVNLDKALILIDKAIKIQPYNSLFFDTKAWILFQKGQIEDAKIAIKTSLDLNPQNAEAIEHNQIISNFKKS
jgi:tetratricopeptide (TPR) repeat protein